MVYKFFGHLINFFVWIDRMFARIVTALLIACLLFMLGLVFYQVILRNFFQSGLVWGEIAARNLVIWVAFLGAALATRGRQHISVDFLTRLIPKSPREVARFIFDGLACVVSYLLARASVHFVLEEKAMETILFGQIPTWVVQVVIPFGFALISFQYAIGMALDLYRLAMSRRNK